MNLPTKQGNYNDQKERERLLAQYAGIFPSNIKEYGEMMKSRLHKPKKNYSR